MKQIDSAVAYGKEHLMKNRETEDYHSYLLRLWREQNSRGVAWRASVECIQNAEWHGFANIEELFEFLRREAQPESNWGDNENTL